ncbi:hypothetical protein SAMN06265827_108107 [Orenia metallireducens]|uniref:Porin domain-containing protein n=1 Tax=Orenia metallireducens TaxID=1413210 RepID=A0A285GLG1_9FIRM|nr:hypothetical protein [Orenia metallireducens]SNY24409.1 hypothetical protein SAMN06265827_108107 [Orenia metallireducens]
MKKISLLLTCALVMALAVPAFAAEDNVKVTGEVKTVFEVGNYSSGEETATVNLWADDDALDLDNPFDGDGDGDMDDYPAEKAFYQEIDFNVAGNLDNINFNLAVDTLTNVFSSTSSYESSYGKFGVFEDDQDIVMDTALLTISNGFSTLKAGDLEDYNASKYFIYDDEDMEGVEVTTTVSDYVVKAFVLGEDDNDAGTSDEDGSDYYGVTATRNFANGSFTGKLYHGRDVGIEDANGSKVTDLAAALTYDVNELFNVNGEVVFNRSEDANDDSESDSLFNLGAKYKATDVVTVRGMFETVGEDFVAPLADLEEEDANYDLFNIGADFAVNANNTLKADYTMVDHDTDDNKNKFELAWDNVNGAFTNTASVEFITNDSYDIDQEDDDVTVLTVGTKYAMSDVTTITGKLVNQSADDYYDNNFTYLAAGLNTKLSDNMSWNTEAKYITGSDKDDNDGEGNSIKTVLAVSF